MQKRAKIIAYKTYCDTPEQGLTGGILAAKELLREQGLTSSDVDLVEFNESFAGPTLKFINDMGFNEDQVNVNGGALALGHPMGATGGNLTGMLLDELERQDKSVGLVSICGATGSGCSMLIERTPN